MTSIIEYYNSQPNLQYTLSSSGARYSSEAIEYSLSKDSNYFVNVNSPYFWQITFSQPVTAYSYSICTQYLPNGKYVSIWDVSYSNDESEFVKLQRDSISYSSSAAINYTLSSQPSFKHFKITSILQSNSGGWLGISKFDLFSKANSNKRSRNNCTFNIGRYRHRFIGDSLIMMMISIAAT